MKDTQIDGITVPLPDDGSKKEGGGEGGEEDENGKNGDGDQKQSGGYGGRGRGGGFGGRGGGGRGGKQNVLSIRSLGPECVQILQSSSYT